MKKVLLMTLLTTMIISTLIAQSTVEAPTSNANEIIVTDMIGREVAVVPGSYTRVVCIGAGALRM